jgi:hypothetical protein
MMTTQVLYQPRRGGGCPLSNLVSNRCTSLQYQHDVGAQRVTPAPEARRLLSTGDGADSNGASFQEVIEAADPKPAIAVWLKQHGVPASRIGLAVIVR